MFRQRKFLSRFKHKGAKRDVVGRPAPATAPLATTPITVPIVTPVTIPTDTPTKVTTDRPINATKDSSIKATTGTSIKVTKDTPVTPEQLEELLGLIRRRYALDVQVWNLRAVRRADRTIVQEKMKEADALLQTIQETVLSWDSPDRFPSEGDYKLYLEIKSRIFEGGKRTWADRPPWEA